MDDAAPTATDREVIWVLGDQLTTRVGPLADAADERVLMIEATEFARKLPYHPHKLTLIFSAMRHFRDRLRAAGHEVIYERCETFADGLERFFDEYPDAELTVMRPASAWRPDRLPGLVEACGGDLTVVENELFLCAPETFDEWAGDRDSYRHEEFYRFQRRRTGYLMRGDEPLGGEWNYDEENRETPPEEYEAPDPPRYEPDEITREVAEWVAETFDGGYEQEPYGTAWADPEAFFWPVTREQALDALDRFCADRLAEFGPYQDAMVDDEWALNHALLSPALNVGLLTPAEVCERVIAAGKEDPDVPLNSIEGFVRQVLGWREFVRHVYRRSMPELADANQLDATADLPDFFWTGETDMACMADTIAGVRERGYAHHIQRLMLLSNFATTFGIDPAEYDRWFRAAFVDGFSWVTTPNTVGMGVFGSDALSTKPYAASANYVDDMSDYCSGCPYYKTKTTGEGACPFNALYWDFLGRNEDDLRSNHRMGLVYSHWDDKDDDERAAIRERVAQIRELAAAGEL